MRFSAPFFAASLALLAACNSSPPPPTTDPFAHLPEGWSHALPQAATDLCPDGLPRRPFQPGANPGFGNRSGEISFPLLDGTTFSLSQAWTGCESFVFVVLDSRYPTLKGDAATLNKLLANAPASVRFVFVGTGTDTAARAQVVSAQGVVDAAIGRLPAGQQPGWHARVFYTAVSPGSIDGWFGPFVTDSVNRLVTTQQVFPLTFALDRFQVLRDGGTLIDLSTGSTPVYPLSFLDFLPQAYDFELNRQTTLDAQDAVVTRLFDHAPTSDPSYAMTSLFAHVSLPSPATMERFDTMEVDLAITCDFPELLHCAAWDSNVDLFLCDDAEPPHPDAPNEGCDTLIARWITPYARAGRWVVDVSPALAMLQGKTEARFRLYSQVATVDTLDLRLRNAGLGTRPYAYEKLWNGGKLGNTYDALHPALTIHPPADARVVQFWGVLTGHGASTNTQVFQCAEFCNHGHRFTFPDGGSFTQDYPGATSPYGCTTTVPQGTIPNQYGTWIYGRGGWCPGSDVKPIIQDVTQHLTLGQPNALDYHVMVNGADVTVPTDATDNESTINLWSYIVYRK